jgi:hypothetical protein
MKLILAAGLVVAGGLMITAVGVAKADPKVVDGSYATVDACKADGAAGAGEDGSWTQYSCEQHADGEWYLTLLD